MERRRNALIIGGGGTLLYYGVLFAIAWTSSHFHSDAGLMFMMVMALPLFPGILPGGLLSVLLGISGFTGFGFHDTGFAVCCLISTPLVNSYLSYLWFNRKIVASGV